MSSPGTDINGSTYIYYDPLYKLMKTGLKKSMPRANFKKSKAKENLLSNKQILRIKQEIEYEDEQILFYGLLYTGMRISEFIHMRSDWLDFDEMLIKILGLRK